MEENTGESETEGRCDVCNVLDGARHIRKMHAPEDNGLPWPNPREAGRPGEN